MFGGWRIPWLLAATSLTLAATALVAPPPAAASCGDYVSLDGHAARHAARAETPAQPDHRPPLPCHGPLCTRHPAAPPAPAIPAGVSAEEWGHLPSLTRPPRPGAARQDREQTHAHPVHHGSSVYHPPRPDLAASAW
jgi:hypothetical protein